MKNSHVKLIVAGGRDFNNLALVSEYLIKGMGQCTQLEIVCGKARGADRMGELAANQLGLPVAEFPADWDKFGKSAGYKRNTQMAEYADELLAFWDGKSRGTQHMIEIMQARGKPVHIVKY